MASDCTREGVVSAPLAIARRSCGSSALVRGWRCPSGVASSLLGSAPAPRSSVGDLAQSMVLMRRPPNRKFATAQWRDRASSPRALYAIAPPAVRRGPVLGGLDLSRRKAGE